MLNKMFFSQEDVLVNNKKDDNINYYTRMIKLVDLKYNPSILEFTIQLNFGFYYCILSIYKLGTFGIFKYFQYYKMIFCIFYKVINLFLHQSYLKSPLPVKIT